MCSLLLLIQLSTRTFSLWLSVLMWCIVSGIIQMGRLCHQASRRLKLGSATIKSSIPTLPLRNGIVLVPPKQLCHFRRPALCTPVSSRTPSSSACQGFAQPLLFMLIGISSCRIRLWCLMSQRFWYQSMWRSTAHSLRRMYYAPVYVFILAYASSSPMTPLHLRSTRRSLHIRSVYKAFTMVILCGCLTPRSLKQLSSSTISKSMTPWCSTLSRYGCASLISGSFTMV